MIKKWLKGAGDFINGGNGVNASGVGGMGGDSNDSYNRIRLEVEIEENVFGHSTSTVFDSDTERTPILVLVYLYFIVVASVLGTGILAIPVKLAESGFDPFIASYTLCYIMQVLSTFFLIEILQRVYSIIRVNSNQEIKTKFEQCVNDNYKNNSLFSKGLLMESTSSPDGSSGRNHDDIELQDINSNINHTSIESSSITSNTTVLNIQSEEEVGGGATPILSNTSPTTRKRTSTPTFGDDGEEVLELSQWSSTTPITTTSTTTDNDPMKSSKEIDTSSSSTLESEATPNLHYLGSKFLGKYSHSVFIFSVILHFTSVLISYGLAGSEAYGQLFKVDHSYLIAPVILIFTCIIIFGSEALQHIITLFTFGKGTLLVVIVFITGIISSTVKHEISNNWFDIGKSFLISTVALGGSVSVLPIVFPKLVFSKREMRKCYITVFSSLSTVYLLNIIWCWFLLRIIPQMPDPNNPSFPSLLAAEQKGQIATIPLMNVVEQFYPQFLWIARITDIFIVISISISFITVGTGFKHTLDGFGHSWRKASLKKAISSRNQQSPSLLGKVDEGGEEHSLVDANSDGVILNSSQTTSMEMEEIELQQQRQHHHQRSDYPKLLGVVFKLRSKVSDLINLVNQKIDAKENRGNHTSSPINKNGSTLISQEDDEDDQVGGGETRRVDERSKPWNIREYSLYIIGFGFILLVALLNPRGFLMVMENGTSLGLNLQAGLFIVMMLNFSRSHYHHYPIPLPIPNRIFQLRYLVFAYFTFAVIYDFYLILKHIFT